MKRTFHKIVSLVMAFVVLFSTMSLAIDMHYCGDTLVDTAIFKQVRTCGMEMQNSSTPTDHSIVKTNCCNDKQIVIKGQNELKTSIDNYTLNQLFVAAFVHTYRNLFEGLGDNTTTFRDYSPPLVVRELYKLDETYLI